MDKNQQAIAQAAVQALTQPRPSSTPTQHIDMDPVEVTGKAFCPGCGQRMPAQGLPEPYPTDKDTQ